MKNRVKEFREQQGMTQEELAEKSGISRTTISGFENGTIEITTNTTMDKISKALGKKTKTVFFL
ncbi:MAG: helix-turn-helix transcriptional regulator [Clostridia bacterium]|nr:helix-turn-helix transcriptional regulator [Clostridia bacterium]